MFLENFVINLWQTGEIKNSFKRERESLQKGMGKNFPIRLTSLEFLVGPEALTIEAIGRYSAMENVYHQFHLFLDLKKNENT